MLSLSEVIQKGLSDLGRTETFTASGGTNQTVDRSDLDALSAQPSDNYAVGFSLFVNSTTDGLAPQGEFGLVTGYDSGSHQYTLAATLTADIDANDEIIIADSLFPIREMVQRVNRALEDLGEIVATDLSITTAGNQTEYTLPSKIVRRPYLVEIQTVTNDSDDNRYVAVSGWDITPGEPGSSGKLIFENQPPADRVLKIWYGGLHPTLSAYDDRISETVHPSVSVACFTEAALGWFVGRVAGSRANAFWVERWNKAEQKRLIKLAEHPIPKPDAQNKYFVASGYPYDPNEGFYSV